MNRLVTRLCGLSGRLGADGQFVNVLGGGEGDDLLCGRLHDRCEL